MPFERFDQESLANAAEHWKPRSAGGTPAPSRKRPIFCSDDPYLLTNRKAIQDPFPDTANGCAALADGASGWLTNRATPRVEQQAPPQWIGSRQPVR